MSVFKDCNCTDGKLHWVSTVDIPFCFFVTSVLDIDSNHVPNMYYKVSGLYLFSCRIFVGVSHVMCTCVDLYEYSVPQVTVLLRMKIFF